ELLSGEKARGGQLGERPMHLFSSISATLQNADALIAQRTEAKSVLAKAVLSSPTMEAEEALAEVAGQVLRQLEQLEASLPALDLAVEEKLPDALIKLAAAAHTAAFLQRWDAQIQQRRLRL